MCGIVGYIGSKDAYPILMKGLNRLEYRGYDSAGVALISSETHQLNVYKQRGKVADLENYTVGKDCSGHIGIAHTRWATHGEPNQINAHPHLSQSGSLAIIHNGIIENYADLKRQLQEKGYTFKSETDTEVLIQLIEYCYVKITHGASADAPKTHRNLLAAVQLALKKAVGAYAMAIVDKYDTNTIICARKSSPLVVGLGDGEYYLASDATPIVEYTDQVIYLNDGEIALLRKGKKIKIVNLMNDSIKHDVQTIDMDINQLEKGGYAHFMLKEIYEQPNSIKECMSGRVSATNIKLSAVRDHKERLISANRFIIVACGTSWHAALIGKHLLESLCKIPVTVEYASEFRYSNPVLTGKEVVIAISQSGETADTLAAIDLAKKAGALIFGICNAVGSSIPRATDTGCYIHVGPEIGVASTKAFTGQVTMLAMLALCLAKEKGTISEKEYLLIINDLNQVPQKMEQVLKNNKNLENISAQFTYARNFIYLGRGYNYPVALEGALKLKEISYIHAEGYPAAEMKHGPIALIDNEMPVVFIATHNAMYEKVVSNMQEVKARKGHIIAIVSEGDTIASKIADISIAIPEIHECLEPLLTTLPLQVLAYHIAVKRGLDVDQPRNLAKSVTVE